MQFELLLISGVITLITYDITIMFYLNVLHRCESIYFIYYDIFSSGESYCDGVLQIPVAPFTNMV